MQKTTRRHSRDPDRARLEAMGLMCVAVTLFAGLDTLAKYLATRSGLPVVEIVWMRFLGQLVLILLLYGVLRLPQLLATRKLGAQLVRSCLMAATTAFNFLAIKYLRLDETLTIVFLTPLVVALLSGPLLGEWVGWRRFIAILVGFAGILIVVRPGFAEIHPAVGFAFGAMLSYSLFMLLTRHLSTFDPPIVTLFYSLMAGAVGATPFAIAEWVPPPDTASLLMLLSLGAFGGAGHYLFILAYRLAPASVVAPFLYLELISVVMLGFLVFGDLPDAWAIVGSTVVVGSGIYLFHRERVAVRERRREAAKSG